MKEEWLIDGYNLLRDISSSKKSMESLSAFRASPGEILSRTDLCSILAGFAAFTKRKVWAVLDGEGSPQELDVHKTSFFEAVYSRKVSADHYIEKYIYQNKAVLSLVVVTNDRTISDIAHGGGARVLKNSIFLEMLTEALRENKATIHKEDVRSHGFNRPFDGKLKAKGL